MYVGHQSRVSGDVIFQSFVESCCGSGFFCRKWLSVSHLTNSANKCLSNAFNYIKLGIHLPVLLLNLGLAGMNSFLDK